MDPNTQQSTTSKLEYFFWDGPSPQNQLLHAHFITTKTQIKLRFLLSIFCSAFWLYAMFEKTFYSKLQYLTYWGLTIEAIYFVSITYLSIQFYYSKSNITENFVNRNYRTFHILFEIVFSIQFVICVLYWVAVYPGEREEANKDYWTIFDNVVKHGGFFVLICLEAIFNNIKFYKTHFIIITFFAVFYAIINLIITKTHKAVYKALDWESSYSFILIGAALIMANLQFLVGYFLYKKVKDNNVKYIMNDNDKNVSSNDKKYRTTSL